MAHTCRRAGNEQAAMAQRRLHRVIFAILADQRQKALASLSPCNANAVGPGGKKDTGILRNTGILSVTRNKLGRLVDWLSPSIEASGRLTGFGKCSRFVRSEPFELTRPITVPAGATCSKISWATRHSCFLASDSRYLTSLRPFFSLISSEKQGKPSSLKILAAVRDTEMTLDSRLLFLYKKGHARKEESGEVKKAINYFSSKSKDIVFLSRTTDNRLGTPNYVIISQQQQQQQQQQQHEQEQKAPALAPALTTTRCYPPS
ncbi:hypothetical protein V1478_013765, partial [Vespula squamosa]